MTPDAPDSGEPGGADHRSQDARDRPSLTALVDRLIRDLGALIGQELRLARHELRHEFGKVGTAARGLTVGIGITVLGGFLLVIMLVHALQALTVLPLWACYGIVGGLCAAAGLAIIVRAKGTAGDVNVLPPRTMQTIKETRTWLKERTPSNRT